MPRMPQPVLLHKVKSTHALPHGSTTHGTMPRYRGGRRPVAKRAIGVAAQRHLHWAVLLTGTFLIIFAFLTTMTLINVFSVENYTMWAGPVLVNVASLRLLIAFFRYALDRGQQAAESLDYVPLPPSLVQQIEGYWSQNIKVSS